ncbi:MAG TPA: hypothetical protein VF791_15575 [Pyrinomonadaceae bacterium]
MFKKILLLGLICLMAPVTLSRAALAADLDEKEKPSAEEIKKKVESFGVGITARVKIKLQNGAKIKGFIDRAGDDHFYLVRTDEQMGTAVVIAYADVAQIKGQKSTVDWRNVAYKTGTGAGFVLKFLRALRIQGPAIAPRF